MYITSIIFYLTWPALILLSFWLIRLLLKKYEKLNEKWEKREEPEIRSDKA
jgi:hypothetical protein